MQSVPSDPASCCCAPQQAAGCSSEAQFASLSDEFQLLVREIVAQRMDVDQRSAGASSADRYAFPSEKDGVAPVVVEFRGGRADDASTLRKRYDRLRRDFCDRVEQKAGFYRRYARQFLDPHIAQLKRKHSADMDAQKEQYEGRIRELKRQLAEEREDVRRRTTEFYMTKKFDLELKEARRREQELELKIAKLESDAQSRDATLRSVHEARRREKAEVKDLRRSLEEFESAKAELVQLRMRLGANAEVQGVQRDYERRLQASLRDLAAERRRADANYDSFSAARADLVRALGYESALLLAYRSLRAEFVEETQGRRPRTRRPLREDEGLGAASEDDEAGCWGGMDS